MIGVVLQTLFLNDTDVASFEDGYYQPRVINNCYGINNWLIVNIDTKKICLQFDNLGNSQCEAFPNGIYLDIKVNNHPTNVIRGSFDYFDYQTSKMLCYDCPNIDGDDECNFIFSTEAAEVYIKSLTRSTILPIGQIQITHNEYSKCFDEAKSAVFWSRTFIRFELYDSGLCKQLGFTYESFTIVLNQIDGSKITIQIDAFDEAGEPTYIETIYPKYTEIQIDYDLLPYVFNFYNRLELAIIKKLDDITIVQETEIALIQTQIVSEMYIDPALTIWSTYFLIVGEPLENAAELEEQYTDITTQSVIRLQFFDTVIARSIDSVFFTVGKTSFINPRSKLQCSNAFNKTHCLELIDQLNTIDLNSVDILVTYQMQDETDFVVLQSSSMIYTIKRTCWTQVQAEYYESKICIDLAPNFLSNSCPYKTLTPIKFKIYQGEFIIESSLNYSLQLGQICASCINCQDQINDIFKSGSGVNIDIESAGNQYQLVSEDEFNMDYSKLHDNIFYCGVAIAVLICVVAILKGMRLKNGVKKGKAAKKVEVDEFD